MQDFRMLADYNAWANNIVYDAAGDLTEIELMHDFGAFFGSVFGTLSHLITADRIWMHRFTGEGISPSALNERPYEQFTDLRHAREREDRRIIEYVGSLKPFEADNDLEYEPMSSSTRIVHKLAPALVHFFNHQTHHRGQVHAGLTSLGKPSLCLDLIHFARHVGVAYL